MLSADIFGDVEPNTIRFKPAKQPVFKKNGDSKAEPEKFQVTTPKNLKPVGQTSENINLFDSKLQTIYDQNLFFIETTMATIIKAGGVYLYTDSD
jgi:hypothetical protein